MKGERTGAADALSRHPDFGAITCPVDVAPELQWEASYKAEMPEEVKKMSMGILSQWTREQSGMEIDFGEQIGSWSLQAK